MEGDLRRIAAAPLPWESLRDASVIVSGAAGFIPACLIELLLHLNEERDLRVRVTGLVRDARRATSRFGAQRPGLILLEQDLSCALSPEVAARPADIVIHAASPASPARFGPDPVGTLLPNVVGTHHLLELARERGARGFLFVSSSEVYGRVPPEALPLRESFAGGELDPLAPRSCYAEAKRMGETMCAAWRRQHGVPAVIVRPFHVYGPGMPLRDGRVFSDFVADIVERRPLTMRGDGTAVRSFCYLADAVAGCFTALLAGAPGEAYNVGHPGAVASVRELAARLVALFPARGLSIERAAPPPGALPSPVARLTPDIAKLGARGWAPALGLEEGFRRTVESFA